MSERDYTNVVTEDGTKLTVQKPRLIDLLPSPKDAAKTDDDYGPRDAQINSEWIRGKVR
jgi:hypothetical protein